MKILLVSDTHHDFDSLYRLVMSNKSKIDLLIHLGDGESDIDDLRAVEPLIPIRHISGNCDFCSLMPSSSVVEAEGVKLFITHGHLFGVDYTLDKLALAAKGEGAAAAFFGHTHRQQYKDIYGVQCLNPGSLGKPRDGKKGYAIIEIREGQVICELKRFES